MKKGTIVGTIVGAALLTAAPFSLQWSQKTVALSLDRAEAREGRPSTATSGVSRRAYRRTGYGTAVGEYGYDRYSLPTSCGYVPYGFSYVAPCGYYTSTYAAPYGYGRRPFEIFY